MSRLLRLQEFSQLRQSPLPILSSTSFQTAPLARYIVFPNWAYLVPTLLFSTIFCVNFHNTQVSFALYVADCWASLHGAASITSPTSPEELRHLVHFLKGGAI